MPDSFLKLSPLDGKKMNSKNYGLCVSHAFLYIRNRMELPTNLLMVSNLQFNGGI